jgi:TFIIF-interacting CTD phosphatase-like protein
MPQPLVKALRNLQAYCELVIFTYLPRSFATQILDKIPQLKDIFAHVICQEDAISTEAYLIKDLSILLSNRSIEDIVVIESN